MFLLRHYVTILDLIKILEAHVKLKHLFLCTVSMKFNLEYDKLPRTDGVKVKVRISLMSTMSETLVTC